MGLPWALPVYRVRGGGPNNCIQRFQVFRPGTFFSVIEKFQTVIVTTTSNLAILREFGYFDIRVDIVGTDSWQTPRQFCLLAHRSVILWNPASIQSNHHFCLYGRAQTSLSVSSLIQLMRHSPPSPSKIEFQLFT
ncbi:hypothetical protein E4T56_gene15621 [Termitomyces sp. T112]|nr:hypothetical protein E4T56_gene15621 [Termitomyces sp. T112]